MRPISEIIIEIGHGRRMKDGCKLHYCSMQRRYHVRYSCMTYDTCVSYGQVLMQYNYSIDKKFMPFATWFAPPPRAH